jgi:DNA-binding response OmpR family regulator
MPRLLLVEDNQHIQRIFRDKFQREGFQVTTAADGEQGVRLAQEGHPDAVLLDIMLPVLDGFEVLKRLRADPSLSGTPIFMLSNRSGADDVQRALTLGARQFYAKGTVPLQEMVSRIRDECGFKKVLVCAHDAVLAAPIAGAVEHPRLLCSIVTVFAETIGTAERGSPDAVILDARPPAPNAFLVLQQLKASPKMKSVPVIVIGTQDQATPRADVFVNGDELATELRPAALKLLALEPAQSAPIDADASLAACL